MTCKEYAKREKERIKKCVETAEVRPKLTVIQVGDVKESNSYITGKQRDCEQVGIEFDLRNLPEDVAQEEIELEICKSDNSGSDGIIVQLPLPKHLHIPSLISKIPPNKDVDGFRPEQIHNPCTPQGIIDYLKANNVKLEGLNAVVVGRSDIVGKPMARMLLEENCTVTVCHSKTENLAEHTKRADLIVVAVGKPKFFTEDMIDPERRPIVIDVGINVGEDGKFVGDCDYENLVEHCSIITPVPKGVGLLTRVSLLQNVIEANHALHTGENW